MKLPSTLRKDFPILSEQVYGKPLIYFDNAATTQKPTSVIECMDQMYFSCNANIHRGVHYLSQKSTELHENARQVVADFIGAAHAHEIIFTRGTTESINLVASSMGQLMEAGDEIIISAMEHHSNIVPWQLLCERRGTVLKVLPFDEHGVLQLDLLPTLLTNRTKLVSVTHVSNALGTLNPIKKLIEICHAHDIPVLVDAAQSVAHHPLDVQALDADFLAFSGHKIYGPTGIGVLYGKEKWLNAMPPYQGGGEMIDRVTFEHTTFNTLPFKFEAGTPNYVGSVGLAAAIDYLNAIGMPTIESYEHDLVSYAYQQLAQIPHLRFIGDAPERSGLISFLVGNIHPFDAGTLLDKLGIAIRTGHHCAQPVMECFQIEGTMRVSFSFYNTQEEIDQFIVALQRVITMLS